MMKGQLSRLQCQDQRLHIKTANHSSFYQIYTSPSKGSGNSVVFADLSINLFGGMGSTTTKKWGNGRQFWGLNWDYDPQWILNEEQREIQGKLMECCRNVIRPNAVSV